ncbi:MAG: uncharacterized protein PWR07_1939 [Bacillota bacterium]|nr:uncharacterized protein [Bacillota bacterium]NLG80020.1 type II toxin-antitoxin system VapC family toxin [Bacillota bacterium]
MGSRYFLDTSYVIALSVPKDRHHRRALELASQIEASKNRLITTRAVVLEIGNALAKRSHREAAVALLESLANDPLITIVPLSERLYRRAFALYQERPDKEWGLTDCCAFIVMNDMGIHEALTADDHFRQAGFRALLLE